MRYYLYNFYFLFYSRFIRIVLTNKNILMNKRSKKNEIISWAIKRCTQGKQIKTRKRMLPMMNKKKTQRIITHLKKNKYQILLSCMLTMILSLNIYLFQNIYPSGNDHSMVMNVQHPLISSSSDSISSLFHCDGEYGKCVYFYPSKFFSKSSSFRYMYDEVIQLMTNHALWKDMPRVGSPTFSYDENMINPNTHKPYNRHNVTFIHVHKAGGTNIIDSINDGRNRPRRKGPRKRLNFPQNDKNEKRVQRNKLYSYENYLRTNALQSDHLQYATKYKSKPELWTESDHLMYAFIRDPIKRFISSIGQAMGAEGSTRNQIGAWLQQKCIQNSRYTVENARFTIQCVINMIKTKGYYIELHFTPQAIEIAFATQIYPNLPVAIFKFEDHYKDVLTELGLDPNAHRRDGSKSGYRPFPVLSEMSEDDVTDDIKREVCQLYKVDVMMSRSIGLGFDSCKAYV